MKKLIAAFIYLGVVGVLLSFAFTTAQFAQAEDKKEEVLEGTLEVLHQDDFESKKSKETYFLKTQDERVELQFSGKKPQPKSGSKIKVKGSKKDGVLAIGDGGFQVTSEASIIPTPKKVAVILINFQNDTSQPYTAFDAKSAIFTATDSSKSYFQETSFNKLTLEGQEQIEGDVFGWYTIPYDNTDCSNYWLWAPAARNAAYNDGHNMEGYTNYVYAFPSTASCNWGGLAYILGPESWINQSNVSYVEEVASHELGHNFGVHHASSYNCLDSNGARVPISANCSTDEYGDPFDVMGFPYLSYYHMNNFHKGQLGWFERVNTQTIIDNGTYNITPLETSSTGVSSLRIPRKDSSGQIVDYYYLEYRQPFGFDNFLLSDNVVNGVSIRIAPEYDQILQSKLIDTTPETNSFVDSALTLGKTFSDLVKNITVTLTSLTSTSATVEVTVTPPAGCIRANPGVSLSPRFQTDSPGETLSYTLSVTNSDTANCGSSSFTVTFSSTRELTQVPNPFNLTIDPGVTVDTTVNITSASNAADNVYSFQEIVVNDLDPTFTATASGQYEVIASDTISPTVSITEPTAGSVVSSLVTIEANAADNVGEPIPGGISKVEFYADSTLLGIATSSPYSTVWETTSFSNSVHNLLVKAYDLVGNIGTSQIISVEVDNLAPNVSITSPVNEASVSGIVNIAADASDANGVEKVEFYVDNNLLGTDTSATYSASWNTASYPSSSTHTIFAKAYDSLGNIAASSTINVTIADTTSPAVTITSPVNGSSVSGIVQISADATDDATVTMVDFLVDGVVVDRDSTAPYSINWDTTILPSNSSHTLFAKAYDGAGNTTSSSTVTVTTTDQKSPVVSIQSPLNNSDVYGITTITASASDDVGINYVEMYVDGGLQGTVSTTPYSVIWDTTGYEVNSLHEIYAKAVDSSGHTTNSSEITVRVIDNIAPVVSLTSPSQNSLVSGVVNLAATASDNKAVASVEFLAGNTSLGVDSSAPYSASWNTQSFTDGAYTLKAKALDSSNNQGTSSDVNVVVDNTSPSASLTSPVSQTVVSGNISVSVLAEDVNGVAKVEIYLDNNLINTLTSSPYSFVFNTNTISNGSHAFKTKSYDLANNSQTSAVVNITVDNQSPTVSLTSPVNGSFVEGVVNIEANASDNIAVTKVEFYVDNNLLGASTTSPYTASWDTSSLPSNSTQTLFAKAYDGVGHISQSDTVSVTVSDTTAPATSITSPLNDSDVSGLSTITAEASDDVEIDYVEIYVDGTLQGTVSSAPYSVVWDTTSYPHNSLHQLHSKAYDVASNSTSSQIVTVKVLDVVSPTVNLTNPINGSSVSGIVNIAASASDTNGVQKVEFYVDSTLLGTSTSAPYSANWDTRLLDGNTSHTVEAKAYDTAGNTSTSSVTVTSLDQKSPTVFIQNPLNNFTVSGISSITASASDDVGVTKVEIYVDGLLQGTVISAPYSVVWDTRGYSHNSGHTILAKAYDGAGHITTSSIVTVTVTDVVNPTVNITSPLDGSLVSKNTNITITASASDLSGVQKVEFYVNNTLTCTDTTSSYSCVFKTINRKSVVYNLSAKAYDSAGNIASSSITVTTK